MEPDVVQRLLDIGVRYLHLRLPVAGHLGLEAHGVAVAVPLHADRLFVAAGGEHRQRGLGLGVDVAVRQIRELLAVVDLEPGVDAGGFAQGHGVGHLHLHLQVVVEAHHGVDHDPGIVSPAQAAGHDHVPVPGLGLDDVQHDVAAALGDGDAIVAVGPFLVPQGMALPRRVHQRHSLQQGLVLGHEGDVHRGVGDAVVGHGERRVQRGVFRDGLYLFRGALGLDQHLQQLAVQVGLGGHQHVAVFAVRARLAAAGLGQGVDEHHEGVGILHVLLGGQGDDVEVRALRVHPRHDLGGLLIGLDVLGPAEGIGAVGQVVYPVRQQYDAGIPLEAGVHVLCPLQGGADVGVDVPALLVGRGVEIFADPVVQGRVVDIQRAVADAVLRAAEHDHAQLAPAAQVSGGHHVLVHQLRGVEAQALGVRGAPQRVPPRGAFAVVDNQYVIMGLHRRRLRRRLGQSGPGRRQRQQRDQHADAPSAHALQHHRQIILLIRESVYRY